MKAIPFCWMIFVQLLLLLTLLPACTGVERKVLDCPFSEIESQQRQVSIASGSTNRFRADAVIKGNLRGIKGEINVSDELNTYNDLSRDDLITEKRYPDSSISRHNEIISLMCGQYFLYKDESSSKEDRDKAKARLDTIYEEYFKLLFAIYGNGGPKRTPLVKPKPTKPNDVNRPTTITQPPSIKPKPVEPQEEEITMTGYDPLISEYSIWASSGNDIYYAQIRDNGQFNLTVRGVRNSEIIVFFRHKGVETKENYVLFEGNFISIPKVLK